SPLLDRGTRVEIVRLQTLNKAFSVLRRSENNSGAVGLQSAGDKASSPFEKNHVMRVELDLVPAGGLRGGAKLPVTAHELPARKNRFDSGYQIGPGPQLMNITLCAEPKSLSHGHGRRLQAEEEKLCVRGENANPLGGSYSTQLRQTDIQQN